MEIWKRGDIIKVLTFDSDIGCVTLRDINYKGKKYMHIMHNGMIVDVVEIKDKGIL